MTDGDRPRIYLAANRGDMGGGELMLLRLAVALGDLGYAVTAVVPSTPGDLAVEAQGLGLDVEEVPCRDRRTYASALRRWDRTRAEARQGVLWCNGLLPALATAGRPRRVVHLHQLPSPRQQPLARLARRGAAATVVPSEHLAGRLIGGSAPAEVLPNWTGPLAAAPHRPPGDQVTVGFIGRIGTAKGVHVLAEACGRLAPDVRRRVRLLVAGDDRFVPARDRRTVQEALASSGVRVEQPGWVDPVTFFAGVDVAVAPSVLPESFGLVVAEAMAVACPVVVSDAGALVEVVGPDHPWVVPAGDPAALAQTLAAAIDALPAAALVAAQRHRWEAEYSPAAGRRHLEGLVDRLVGRGVLEARGPGPGP